MPSQTARILQPVAEAQFNQLPTHQEITKAFDTYATLVENYGGYPHFQDFVANICQAFGLNDYVQPAYGKIASPETFALHAQDLRNRTVALFCDNPSEGDALRLYDHFLAAVLLSWLGKTDKHPFSFLPARCQKATLSEADFQTQYCTPQPSRPESDWRCPAFASAKS